jgi:hypothetical protein
VSAKRYPKHAYPNLLSARLNAQVSNLLLPFREFPGIHPSPTFIRDEIDGVEEGFILIKSKAR